MISDLTSSVTYNTSAPLANDGEVDAYFDVDDIALVPTIVIPQPVATKSFQLDFGFATMTDGTNRAIFNNITFNYGLVPSIFSELSLGSNATIQEAYGPSAMVVDHLEVFDFIIRNTDAGKHPL
jgi:iron transport multicopper oxidase